MHIYIMLGDETNQQPSPEARFFIYGAVLIRSDYLKAVHDGVRAIRHQAKYSATDQLKFESRSCPKGVSHATFNGAKEKVLQLCFDNKVTFIAYVVHHEIAATQSLATKTEWAANTILGCFNRFCEEKDATGIALFDRLPDDKSWSFLREKHQIGLVLPRTTQPLDRVHCFAQTCSGASHLASVADIVLGAFRFCVNSSENQSKIAEKLFPKVAGLLWYRLNKNNVALLREFGLLFRPKQCAAHHQHSYDELAEKIGAMTGGPIDFLDDA